MTHKKAALITASLFFILWLGILYAGADHPPPPGFVLVILIDLAASAVIYLRVPVYLNWYINHKKYRLLRICLEGLLAGLMVGMLMILLPGSRQPGFTPTQLDRFIWLAVLGLVGMANAVFVYFLGTVINKVTLNIKHHP